MEQPKEGGALLSDGKKKSTQIGIVVAVGFIAAMGGMYGWKVMGENDLQAQMKAAAAQHATDRQALIQRARELDAQQVQAGLERMSAPLAWVLRREVMAKNLDQVDQYFTDLVQMPGFEHATLADPEGQILVASDRKRLAQAWDALYPMDLLQTDKTQVSPQASGVTWIVIPVMGLDQKLAVAVVEFKPDAYVLP